MAHQTSKPCQLKCSAQLTDSIILGEWYEARVRVQPIRFDSLPSLHWSEWSPTVSWKDRTGKVKSMQWQPGKAVILTFLKAF